MFRDIENLPVEQAAVSDYDTDIRLERMYLLDE